MQIKIYEVQADRETGEWLHEPKDTGAVTDWDDWLKLQDTDAEHFDTYEVPVTDGETDGEETRAIRVTWA